MFIFSYKRFWNSSGRAFTYHCLMEVDYPCTGRFFPLSTQSSSATDHDNLLCYILFKTSATFFSFIKWLNFIKWLWCLKYSVSLWSKSISNLLFTHRHTNCFLKHHPYNNQNICVCNLCFFLAKSSLAVIRHNNVNIPMMDDTKDSLSLSHIGIIELSHFIWLQLSFLQCTHINLTRCLSGLLTQRAL